MSDIRARIDELKRKFAEQAEQRLARRASASGGASGAASTDTSKRESENGGIPGPAAVSAAHDREDLQTSAAAFYNNGPASLVSPSTADLRTPAFASTVDEARQHGANSSETAIPTIPASHAQQHVAAPSTFSHPQPPSSPRDHDELAALRTQVATLTGMLRDLDARSQQATAQRDSALAEVQRARDAAAAAAAARDDNARKLEVLKQRLLTEQSEAEEASAWRVEEALERAQAEHSAERDTWRQTVGALQEQVAALQARLATADGATAATKQLSERLSAAERRAGDLQQQLAAAEGQLRETAAALTRAEGSLRLRDEELSNLQAAMGELTYEAETANRIQLELHRVQAELRHAVGERQAADATCTELRSELNRSSAEATELRQRCQSAEQRCVALSDEALRLRGQLTAAQRAVDTLTAESRTQVDRRAVAELVVQLVSRRTGRRDVLQTLSAMLSFTDEEQAKLGIAPTPGDNPPRGLLGRIARLPGMLLQPPANPAKPGMTSDWVSFLTAEALDGTDTADAVQDATPQHPHHNDAASPLTSSGPSAAFGDTSRMARPVYNGAHVAPSSPTRGDSVAPATAGVAGRNHVWTKPDASALTQPNHFRHHVGLHSAPGGYGVASVGSINGSIGSAI